MTILSYGFYLAVLYSLPSPKFYLVAHFSSYVFQVTVSYAIHSKFVFRSKPAIAGLFKYFLSSQINLWVGTFLLLLLVERLGVAAQFAPIIILLVTAPVFFFLNRKLVFKK